MKRPRVIISFSVEEAEALGGLSQYKYEDRHLQRGLRKLKAAAKWAKEKESGREGYNARLPVAEE